MHVEASADDALTHGLLNSWEHEDEWYVYFSQPEGAQIVSYIDGEKILPNGNMLWIKDKDFGMGNYHPIAWSQLVGEGKSFYTSMGHSKEVWQENHFVNLIENALRWAVN
ncbi:hypothetical protein BH23BAC1_BH23BAC1_43630 [soil metagenome]